MISLLMNEGDSVLVERYTYSHLIDNVINFKGCADCPAHALLPVDHQYQPQDCDHVDKLAKHLHLCAADSAIKRVRGAAAAHMTRKNFCSVAPIGLLCGGLLVPRVLHKRIPHAQLEVDRRYKAVPLDTDRDGILPASLRETLESTHRAAKATNTRPPRVLYTVPTGQNPTVWLPTLPMLQGMYRQAIGFALRSQGRSCTLCRSRT